MIGDEQEEPGRTEADFAVFLEILAGFVVRGKVGGCYWFSNYILYCNNDLVDNYLINQGPLFSCWCNVRTTCSRIM